MRQAVEPHFTTLHSMYSHIKELLDSQDTAVGNAHKFVALVEPMSGVFDRITTTLESLCKSINDAARTKAGRKLYDTLHRLFLSRLTLHVSHVRPAFYNLILAITDRLKKLTRLAETNIAFTEGLEQNQLLYARCEKALTDERVTRCPSEMVVKVKNLSLDLLNKHIIPEMRKIANRRLLFDEPFKVVKRRRLGDNDLMSCEPEVAVLTALAEFDRSASSY